MTTVTTRREAFLFVMGVDREIAEALGEEPLVAQQMDAQTTPRDVDRPIGPNWPDGVFPIDGPSSDHYGYPSSLDRPRHNRAASLPTEDEVAHPVDSSPSVDRPPWLVDAVRMDPPDSEADDDDVSLPAEAAEEAASSRRNEEDGRPGSVW